MAKKKATAKKKTTKKSTSKNKKKTTKKKVTKRENTGSGNAKGPGGSKPSVEAASKTPLEATEKATVVDTNTGLVENGKKDPGASVYSTNQLAKSAVNQLSGSLQGLKVNDLNSYVNDTLRNDFKDYTDYGSILGKYNTQSDAAWELSKQQQQEAMNAAESQNYAATKNAVDQMRRSLIGSASSGGNVGAANATALQAMLGLGQQNAATTTEGMQNWQNTSKEAAAARAANAVSALDSAREGTNSMYGQATSAYGADHTYGVQGAAEAYGNIASSAEQSASQERQNNATNKTQVAVENTTKKTKSTEKVKQTVKNK